MKRLPQIRKVLVLLLGLFTCLAHAQTDFFKSVKVEATIVVKKHPMGSDLVELTILGADFPQSAIDDKMAILTKELGNEPRGLQTSVSEGQFVKASFAINGLITNGTPKVNLVALARAMAFGQIPIRSFSVFFDGLNPDRATPARWFAPKDSWLLEGIAMKSPRGLEYRIQVNTKDPNEIYMPGNDPVKPVETKASTGGSSKLFIFGGIIVGAIALGLLVYSALLRPRSRAR